MLLVTSLWVRSAKQLQLEYIIFPRKVLLKTKKKNNKKDWLGPEEVTEYITFKCHAEVHTNNAVF